MPSVPSRMRLPRRLARGLLAALLLSGFLLVHGTPSGASACTGGIAFDWAVAHEHGGIVKAVVESRVLRADFSEDLVVTNPKVLRGDPPLRLAVNSAAGLPCDQVADRGETVLLIYDVRGVTGGVPLYYVIDGPDALNAAVTAHGLRPTAPPTDALPPADRRPAGTPDSLLLGILACVGAIAFAFAARWTGQPRSSS
jgi:hypothetical protein